MFRDLKDVVFGCINLNDEAKKYVENIETGDLLDSDFCKKIVNFAADKYNADFTYGGWMENREYLWKGRSLKKCHSK